MPGDSRRKIDKGAGLEIDSIIMDLEDGVALNNKQAARDTVAAALREVDFAGTERLVRLNMVVTGWLYQEDIAQTVAARPDGYVLPKVENELQIRHVSAILAAEEERYGWPRDSIKLLAIVETAKGVVNLREIAGADPRLDGIIFGAEDLAGDLGAKRTPAGWEVFYARSAVVTHAKAFNLQAIDTVFVDLKSENASERLIDETRTALDMGYTGKLAIHPRQIKPIQRVFTPAEDEIIAAKKLIAAHDEHQAAGVGAFEYDGKMVDMPMIRSAMAVISRARAAGVDVEALAE